MRKIRKRKRENGKKVTEMQVSDLGMANLCQTKKTGKVIKEYGVDYDATFSIQAAAFGTYLLSK